MNKLILKVYKPKKRAGEQNVIKVTDSAMMKIEQLQVATGLSIKDLASRMIEFASEYVEIEVEE